MRTERSVKVLVVIAILFGAGCFQIAVAQDEDQSKAIKAEEFVKTRPPAKRPSANAKYRPASKATVGSTVAAAPPAGMVFAQLGVTIWRFRPATSGDKTKELVEEAGGAEPTQWALERVEEGTLLAPGQRVRLSLESLSRDGYLYVIDREQYADGTMGDAHLIFPTKRTSGDNRVKAGRLIYIPAPPNYFRIKPSQSAKGQQVAEVLTVLVSPEPLVDPSLLSTKSITLPREQVEGWEKKWAAEATRFEMDGGAGQTMTEKEQAAGADNSQELTQDDPVPQTIYRITIKPETPLVVTVQLKFAKAN
jgi:hypothetical protein